MAPSDFVEQLKQAVPSKTELLEADFDINEVEEEIERYTCRRREQPLRFETNGDNFLELILGWDLSSLEIGPLTFEAEPIVRSTNLVLGKVELDEFVYDCDSKSFLVLDHEVSGRTFCEAASNGSALMSALLTIATFYGKHTIDFEAADDEEALLKLKNECVEKLGSKYEAFCTSLLGV